MVIHSCACVLTILRFLWMEVYSSYIHSALVDRLRIEQGDIVFVEERKTPLVLCRNWIRSSATYDSVNLGIFLFSLIENTLRNK
jgi:hypothetical protein